jgi:DNA-binding response OmpR family regulator
MSDEERRREMENGQERPKLLVIDDNESFLLACTALLEEDFEVQTAPTGEAGLALLDEDTDVILLDICLPGMHGMEVVRQTLRRESPPEIIILTALRDLCTAVEALKHGVFDYVLKPIDNAALRARLWQAAAHRHSRQKG